mmetsp:Transcript_59226/g.176165  ORF Transcript_59226/g.176165 Transcript_59226/m.176165 type:complete len:212 (+) Transcript_59226:3-638(+)
MSLCLLKSYASKTPGRPAPAAVRGPRRGRAHRNSPSPSPEDQDRTAHSRLQAPAIANSVSSAPAAAEAAAIASCHPAGATATSSAMRRTLGCTASPSLLRNMRLRVSTSISPVMASNLGEPTPDVASQPRTAANPALQHMSPEQRLSPTTTSLKTSGNRAANLYSSGLRNPIGGCPFCRRSSFQCATIAATRGVDAEVPNTSSSLSPIQTR